jgi:hypothetical protein
MLVASGESVPTSVGAGMKELLDMIPVQEIARASKAAKALQKTSE